MGRWANIEGARWGALEEGVCAPKPTPTSTSIWPFGADGLADADRPRADHFRAARELERLRQLRGLSLVLAQACTVDDIVDTLSVRVAADCGAETSVVYLMDPDQEDVLRLAAARGLPGRNADPAVLCRDGGALIARAVRSRQPQLTLVREPGSTVTVVACPLMLRADPLGAFAYGFPGSFALDGADQEFLLGSSGLVALALDRTAATERAREAVQTSEYMTTVLRRIFGGEQKTPA